MYVIRMYYIPSFKKNCVLLYEIPTDLDFKTATVKK